MKPPTPDGDVYYQCQRCGNCCRWHGDVCITEEETVRIAEFLNMEIADFVGEFTRINANRTGLSLIDQPDGACIFLDGIECTIQPVKPSQCKGFPNQWNFPGWRDYCEAIPVAQEKSDPEGKKRTCDDGSPG